MTENLLPCPFCGARPLSVRLNAGTYWIICSSCEATQEHGVCEKAIAAWNRRATPDGWVLVPVEPSQEMVKAGEEALQSRCYRRIYEMMLGKREADNAPDEIARDAKAGYAAMLAASPPTPASSSLDHLEGESWASPGVALGACPECGAEPGAQCVGTSHPNKIHSGREGLRPFASDGPSATERARVLGAPGQTFMGSANSGGTASPKSDGSEGS